MIFHHHKCIFFHVPKVAGYSIERFLDNEKQRNAKKFDSNVMFGIHNGLYSQHYNYTILKKYVDPSVMNEYFKFCFVRNTYDRLVSAFEYSQIQPKTKDNFKNKIKKIKNNFDKLNVTDHFNTQMNYIFDNNIKILDFVGKYENLQDDMKYVCSKINVEFHTLPKKNISKRTNYKDYYDEESLDIVKNLYKSEIEYFDFKY